MPKIVAAVSIVLNGLSFYAVPCVSAGALLAALHQVLGLGIEMAFTLGACAAIGPVYQFYASGWGMRRLLVQLREWKESGLVQAREYDELRRGSLAWFRDRRFPATDGPRRSDAAEPPDVRR